MLESLRDSERRFRNIVNEAPMGMQMFKLTSSGELILMGANPAADCILGVVHDNLIGKPILEAFPGLSDTSLPDTYLKIAREGTPLKVEHIEEQDGSIVKACEIHAFQTSPGIVVATILNVTDRKRAEAELQRTRADIEATVEKRTRELARANQQLNLEIEERQRAETTLRFKTTLLKAQSETSIEGILVVAPDGSVISCNSQFAKLWNIPEEILSTRDDQKLLDHVQSQLKDREGFLEKVRALYGDKELCSRDEIPFNDGRVFDRYSSPLVDEEGRYHGRVWFFRDITEMRNAERALTQAKITLEQLLSVARQLEVAESEEKVYDLVISAVQNILGLNYVSVYWIEVDILQRTAVSSDLSLLSPETIFLKDVKDLLPSDEEDTTYFEDIRKRLAGPEPWPEFRSMISGLLGEDAILFVLAREERLLGEQDRGTVALLLGHAGEALNRLRLEQELRDQAVRDPLTGVYNRRYFFHILQKEVERAMRNRRPLAFLMADIDLFKDINDRHGHHTGDEILKAVAAVILKRVRKVDTVVRYGGDEFLVILPDTGDAVEVVRQNILDEMKNNSLLSDIAGSPVTLSLGGAYWNPQSPDSPEEALKKADQQMYRNKKRTRESGSLPGLPEEKNEID
ncbi:MAG TPA: diguanylate cyclase [Thermoanaerobaculia bacterium]|nr:diguanylate cyclase [Thermoanaerobaculia bacterium]HUM29850.1 diguanylate cyclase [Thermoanaerobaculia bacterium]HXK68125.1 diguanylate cyclase [Thermoanaerobaculia bacterium]